MRGKTESLRVSLTIERVIAQLFFPPCLCRLPCNNLFIYLFIYSNKLITNMRENMRVMAGCPQQLPPITVGPKLTNF